MEDICEKNCVFEDSIWIDFDYEFDDVAKFYDFTRHEMIDDINDAEMWFQFAPGYPPSPLILKLAQATEELEASDHTSSSVDHMVEDDGDCGASEVSSLGQGKKGKSKCSFQSSLPKSSRLLQPTASHLAKQNQHVTVGSARSYARHQKLGSSLKTPGEITATKRQKLEIGYLRKFAHLKHQINFSHKHPKKTEATGIKSSTKPKATVPKEPDLATARRAQRQRSKNAAQPCNNSESNRSGSNVSPQDKSDQSGLKAHQSNKKISSNKGDIGVFRNSKQETPVLKESKLSGRKKLPQNLPIELFKKLSLNSMNHHGSSPEHKQTPPVTKGLKKSLSSVMKENKIPNIITEKPRRRCMEKIQSVGGRLSHISKTIQPVPGA